MDQSTLTKALLATYLKCYVIRGLLLYEGMTFLTFYSKFAIIQIRDISNPSLLSGLPLKLYWFEFWKVLCFLSSIFCKLPHD